MRIFVGTVWRVFCGFEGQPVLCMAISITDVILGPYSISCPSADPPRTAQ